MKIKKRILSLALAGTMALGLMPGMTMTALADGNTSTYTLTIPSTLSVANSGWNATDGISATGTLASGKKLTVTASSGDEFALVSGENKVNYKLAESGDADTTYANATEKTAWEFTTLGSTAATQPMGIIVEDYSSKPAGTYQDTVTFTAKVESSAVVVTGITLNKTSMVIEIGTNETLKATVEPADATDKTVTWSSDNEAVATVADGVVTPVAIGTTTITAKAGDKEATCTVTVKKAATLADAFENGAVVNVRFTLPNSGANTTVTGTYDGNNYANVSWNPTWIPGQTASLSKSGNNIIAYLSNSYGNMTITFDTTNNTYTTSAGGGRTGMYYPTGLEYITVNGEKVNVTQN